MMARFYLGDFLDIYYLNGKNVRVFSEIYKLLLHREN